MKLTGNNLKDVLTAMFLVVGSACGQNLKVVPLINLGDVLPRSKVQAKVALENTGTSTLKIFDVKTSCTCTVPNFEQNEIESGNTKNIDIIINVPNGIGRYETQVALATNDPAKAIHEVRIRYNIEPVVRMLPERIATWVSVSDLPQTVKAAVQCTKPGAQLEEVKVESVVPWLKVKNLGIQGNLCPLEITITKDAPQGIVDLPLKTFVKLSKIERVFHPRAFFGADIYGDENIGARFVNVSAREVDTIIESLPKWATGLVDARIVGDELTNIRIAKESGKWKLSVPEKRDKGNSGCILFSDADGRDIFSIPVYIAPTSEQL